LEAVGIGKDFLSSTLAAQQLKKNGQMDYMKLKASAQQKKWSLS
jgi:hypothetical protein